MKINSIPKKTILILSGVSCTGKTTTAYRLVQRCSEFRRVSELDIVRTIIRTVINNISDEGYLSKDIISSNFSTLFKSLSTSDYTTAKLQSQMLIPYVKEIILHQQQRNITTVLEGACIIPSTYFPNNHHLNWLNKYVIFINLYLPNKAEHIERRKTRCLERNYFETIDETKKLVDEIRANKNILLHQETLKLSKKYKNVFSLNISGLSTDEIVDTILKLIIEYYTNF